MGVVTMIESFPARSEACQNSIRAPQDPLERLVCRKRRELGAKRGVSLFKREKRKCGISLKEENNAKM